MIERRSRPEANPGAAQLAVAAPSVTARSADGQYRSIGPQPAVELRRRRAAAARLVPLDCGCRDPWPCRCTDPPLTDQAVDGWAAAARHLLADGRIPLVPLEVLRALHRRGGPDRALAEELHAATGGFAA